LAAAVLVSIQIPGGGVQAQSGCGPTVNPIVCENQKPGNLASEWDITGAGDSSIQGFATSMSVAQGQTVVFKIKTPASAYTIDIYRLGYYGGAGARKITTISPSASLPQTQPSCLTQSTTGLIDCGNWAVSASWLVPTDAVSGIYFAKLTRNDTGGDSHIVFIVRDDTRASDLLFQTSDTTWQAYNSYGGNSLYTGGPGTNHARAYKVSYNRPFNTRSVDGGQDWLFNAEYPMVRWLEANGYDVSYTSGIDADRSGSLMLNHKVYLSVGHDEYWSARQRANVEAARAAGVHLAFFSGNEIFWKTRWENSIDTSNTPYRTLVSYKETHAGAKIDPSPEWTGTWADPRFSPPADGGRPQNALSGTYFMVNTGTGSITVPAAFGKHRFWRNTTVATLPVNGTATFPNGTLGYEWDSDVDNGFRPAGLMRLSQTTMTVPEVLLDYGSTYGPGAATHALTLYRHPSGALVFGAGTVQWAWGLDASHDRAGTATDIRMQQATVNLFADMTVQPGSLQSGLVTTSASPDTLAPQSTITAPTAGSSVVAGSPVTISGTATDGVGGGLVTSVEVSTDGGTTWKQATGTTSWSYAWTAAGSGAVTLKSRAYDDTGNRESPSAGVSITVNSTRTCPCTIFSGAATPTRQDDGDPNAIEVGMRFRSDVNGYVTGVRFHKGTTLNGGTHLGHLWTNTGTLLGSVTFTNETASGWQQANFNPAIPISANTTYVISYYAPQGHYPASGGFFATSGVDNPPLHALRSGVDGPNGVYIYGASAFPTNTYQSEYDWVDVVFDTVPPVDTPPTVTSTFPAANATGVDPAAAVTATFSEAVDGATVSSNTVQLRDPSNNLVTASVTYDATTRTVTLRPATTLALSTTYAALIKGGAADPRVKDLAGNALAANVAWSFTTAAAPPPPSGSCPCTIWGTTVPSVPDDGDPASIEVGTKFRSDVAGHVTGARFYKSPLNTGTHTATLWTATGTQLATATFTGETASGWQQVLFATPAPIAANTTYVISYHAPNGHYAAPDNYFATSGVDNPPLHALRNGIDGPNGVYAYSTARTFPTQTYFSEAYFVDVVFSSGPDTTKPVVTSVSPANGALGVRVNASVTATFSESMNATTISASTFRLLDPSNAVVPATVSYTAGSFTATLTPNANLAYATPYTAVVTTGAKDLAGNAIAAEFRWTIATTAPPPPPPTQGPGGPLLVITTAANPFSTYYAEILRGEGANAFTTMDLSQVSASTLAGYDVAILGEAPLSAAQVTMFTNWVTGGGNLIAMRPDKQLAGLLGLSDAGGTLANAYLLVNTASTPGTGIVGQTIQYHGTSDRYTLNGATSLATLYSTASVPTTNPAVTMRPVGSGHAVAFAFDLAKSVIYTRQGNPAWSGQERDGVLPIRSDDLFFGARFGDVQPDWVDLAKVAIPQADEQQRFLWNIILSVNASKKPLPRFWYLPRMLKAAVVMTGDDHAVGGTADRFDSYLQFSPPGCVLEDWECVRGSSYIYPHTPISDAVASGYVSQGFEIGLHVSTNCADWTPSTLTGFYNSQLTEFATAYPSLPSPVTNRTHCIVWSDYTTQAQVEFSNGIRFDTNYYYYPSPWVANRPGVFTGSGMPQRFTTATGAMIDVYQAATQMTDESGQVYPTHIDALLNAALGTTGYYGVFTANMHTDHNNNEDGKDSKRGSDLIVAAAQARGVPVVSAKQMLDWLDGRNGSSFQEIEWAGNVLSFTVAAGTGATGLRTLVPATFGGGSLSGVTSNGTGIPFALQTIKGVQYATFAAGTGAVRVSYGPDITPPVISGPTSTSTASTATIAWTTNETSDSIVTYGTDPSALTQSASNATPVTAHSVTLSGLAPATTYYYQVSSADAVGNRSTAPLTAASFTTSSLSVSGTISPAAAGAGATVTLTGAATATVTANASGQYTFGNLGSGSYTVSASKPGYVMTPASQPVTVATANVTGVNFAGQAVTISGTITPVAVGAGAIVALSGAANGSVSADAQGAYTFTAVANGNYTVTPSRAGYTFTPSNAAVTVAGASVSGVDFAGQAVPTYSISGTVTPATISAGATVTLSGGATATTTVNASGGYTFSGLLNGQYTVTPSKAATTFAPPSTVVTIASANATANFTATQVLAPTIDATVFVDRPARTTTLAASGLTTTTGNQLLLAFIASDDNNGTPMSVTGVIGGGVTWTLVRRTNVQRGTAEIWRAFAASTVTNATITATLSQSAPASMTIMSFKGVDTTGTNGSGAIGATGSGNALSGAPTATLTTTRAHSLVIGVGFDWDAAIARTLGPGQTMVHQYLLSGIGTFWVQRLTNPVAASGTVVTINDTAPTADRYDLTICEILAGG
jgi:hypothetical protein